MTDYVDVIRVLHYLDSHLGLAVHRDEGSTARWKEEANEVRQQLRTQVIPFLEAQGTEVSILLERLTQARLIIQDLAGQTDDPGQSALDWLHRTRHIGND